MKTAGAIAATILFAVVLELIYERIATRRPKPGTEWETMEQSMNDGCQTSVRIVGFGLLSAVMIAVIMAVIGL
jgi:hypothetical protein